MFKKMLSMILAMGMVLSLAACGGGSSSSGSSAPASGGSSAPASSDAASGKTVTLKLCHTDPSGCATTAALQRFAKEVTDASGGRLVIEEYADGIMGDDDEITEQIYNGAYLINYADPAMLEAYYPDYSILVSPYFYESYDEIAKLKETDFNKRLLQGLRDAGIIALDGYGGYYGSRQIMSNKPIYTPDDLKGLDFRVPNTATWLEMVSAWGANPVTVAFSETYSALQQGVVDCVENPIGSLYANSLQEVCKYMNMTNHFYAVNGIVMNTKVFESLDEDLQQLLLDKAEEFDIYNTEMVLAEEEEVIKKLEEGGTIINRDVDLDAMKMAREKVLEVHGWSQELIDEANAALAEIRK